MSTNERPEWTRRPPDIVFHPGSLDLHKAEDRRILAERLRASILRRFEQDRKAKGNR